MRPLMALDQGGTERFSQSVLPMALVSLDGDLVQVNGAFCALVGEPEDRLVGRPALDLAADADAARSATAAAQAALDAGLLGGQIEERLRRGDGTVVDVQAAWTLLRDPEGEPSYVTLVLLDVTARRRQEQALARSEQRLRARFEQSALPQAVLDLGGVLVAVNEAFCGLLGLTAEGLVGRPIRELNHASDEGRADLRLAEVLSGAVDSARYERVLADASGQALPVVVDASLLRDENGTPVEAATVLQDVRALRDLERRRDHQEQFFLALSRRASDLALVVDVEGRILYASAAVQHVFGYGEAEVERANGLAFIHPDDQDEARRTLGALVRDGGTTSTSLRVRDAKQRWRWVEQTATNLLDTPVGGIVVNLRDITEQIEAERALRASETWYRTLAETAEEGIWALWADGRTRYANSRLCAMLGLSSEELAARPADELVAREDAHRLARLLRGEGAARPERFEVGYPHPDGAERRLWVAASRLVGPDGAHEGLLQMVSDVTDARRGEEELRRAALHDMLTGLPNRTLLQDRLDQAVARRDAAGAGSTAVLLLDLDGFKLLNDSRGHGTGDALLVEVAQRLQAQARPADTVARLGGDEFVVVTDDADEAAALQLAESLHAALRPGFDVGGQVVHVTASVGVAVSPAAAGEDLLRFADTAMYAAKAAGRGRTVVFDRTLADEAERQHALSSDLRLALDQDHLRLHYQPVVDLASGRVVGMEALARWDHPVLGSVPPSRFVAVAEQTGLSGRLDVWAVRRALHDLADLRRRSVVDDGFRVAVNLSARSLTDHLLEEGVVAAAESAGLPPSVVVLEITESAIMADAERAVRLLGRLRAHGFGIALDDFGTGYSSLAYLRDLPVTSIKIDQGFVREVADDRDALAIVASVVDLARAVGVSCVAEGVETAEQAAVLRRLGCRLGQGWLWSRALPIGDVEQASARWRAGYPVGRTRSAKARVPVEQPGDWQVLPEHGGDRLLQLHREGASLTTVAAALNREGFRTPAGSRWHRTTVARTVAQAAYPELDGGARATASE